MSSSGAVTTDDTRHFRDVLGHFPTGVAVITALSPDGTPCGMAVGSFSSVSLDPPLVAFMPAQTSTTFPLIAAAPHFCVSILGADQQHVCRAMATRGSDKFAEIDWFAAPSGAPVIAGALAWIDCTPVQTHEAGDHFIVLGRVDELAQLRPGPPLIFFRGGYGGFHSDPADAELDLTKAIRLAGRARRSMENLALSLGVECLAVAYAGGHTVCLATADSPDAGYLPSRVGYRTPNTYPVASVFSAWDEHRAGHWLPADPAARTAARSALERVRQRGWSIALGDANFDDLEAAVGRLLIDGDDETMRTVMQSLDGSSFDPDLAADVDYDVRMLTAPVFGPEGMAMGLAVRGFAHRLDRAEIEAIAARLVAAADDITRKIGGADRLTAARKADPK